MKEIRWNRVKSERLKLIRGVSFEEIVAAGLIISIQHPKKETQNIMLFRYKGYVWVVPYIEENDYIFLKTLYPSRKYTKLYKKETFNETNQAD